MGPFFIRSVSDYRSLYPHLGQKFSQPSSSYPHFGQNFGSTNWNFDWSVSLFLLNIGNSMSGKNKKAKKIGIPSCIRIKDITMVAINTNTPMITPLFTIITLSNVIRYSISNILNLVF